MKLFEIDFYEKDDGECPVADFLEQIDKKMLAKIRRVMELLERNGPTVRMPYSEHLEDGIFEIRAKQYRDDFKRRYGNEQV